MPASRRYVRRYVATHGGGDSAANAALYLDESGNLTDLDNPSAARTALGLGDSATRNVGTAAGTVAAGNDSRITGALQASGNLSGLASVATSQNNLELGPLASSTDIGRVAAGTGNAGAASIIARADHTHPSSGLDHASYGLLAWNTPWWVAGTGTILPTAGLVNVAKIIIPRAMTITNLEMHVNPVGSGLTSGQNFAGLYNASKQLLSATGDMTTLWTVTNGRKTMPLSVAQPVAAGTYYIAWYWNGGTAPTFLRGIGTTIANSGLAAADSHWATADTGRTTSLPSTLGAFTALATTYVVGVS